MGLTHAQAKEILARAAPELTPAESLAVRAVGWLESNYSAGWSTPEQRDSLNWGAITIAPVSDAGGELECPSNGFAHGDSLRDKKGQILKYVTCFRRYPDHDAAAAHLAQMMLRPNVRAAIAAGDLRGVSAAMRENRYYLGTAPTRRGQINAHHKRMLESIDDIREGTGEPDPFGVACVGQPWFRPGPRPCFSGPHLQKGGEL